MAKIEQARAEDWPAILRFVERCYGREARFKGQRRWHWQMEQAPYPIIDPSRPLSWIAREGSEVIGQISLQAGRLWLNGEPIDIGWIVDVMVHPEHRGRGLGHKLYAAILDAGHVAVTLTMAPATRHIIERAGCQDLPKVAQLMRIRSLTSQTLHRAWAHSASTGGKARWLPSMASKPLASLAARVINLAIGHSDTSTEDRQNDRRIERLAKLNHNDVNRLAEMAIRSSDASFDRSPNFWEWRFEAVPDLEYRLAKLTRGDATHAITAWRKPLACELPIGTITELMCDPTDQPGFEALLGYVLDDLADCEAVVAGTSCPREIKAYQKAGFRVVKWHRPTLSTRDQALLDRIAAARSWRMSKADHDWCQVHPR